LESGRAAQLEVVATEPGHELDPSQRQSLLSHVVESSVPVGHARVGAASANGAEISNLQRVVAGMRAGFGNCYQRALVDAPAYADQLEVRLTVGSDGAVTVAKATSSQRNAGLVACVEARCGAAHFDPPSAGRPASVTFSITLSKP
jgi:hypothetical protein